jgi:cyclic pyranopterin phosphate synthase
MAKIATVHQIELSSRCNLRCHYCPHPHLRREKADMAMEVYKAALDWARSMPSAELSLTGMGEATLHPQFCEMLRMAREALPDTLLLLSTNGIGITDDMLITMRETETVLYISAHRPEIAGRTLQRSLAARVRSGINNNIVDSGFNWAGQVDWYNMAQSHPCQYLAKGWATVLQNGDVVSCCMDAHDLYPCGNVMDKDLPTMFSRTPLCEACHLEFPK